jgi:hypothetical protein
MAAQTAVCGLGHQVLFDPPLHPIRGLVAHPELAL